MLLGKSNGGPWKLIIDGTVEGWQEPIQQAITSGKGTGPWDWDPAGADRRRRKCMKGGRPALGAWQDVDEWPPAGFDYKDVKCSKMAVNRSQNRSFGSCMGKALKGVRGPIKIEFLF
jgi:hypothetical protein